MPESDSSLRGFSLASAGAAFRAVAALLVTAVLAGCAGEPPAIGTPSREVFHSLAWSADGSSVLAYSWMHNRNVVFDVKSGAPRVVSIKDSHARLREFSSDGKLLIGSTGAWEGAWETSSGQSAWKWVGGGGTSLACVSGAEVVIAAGREVVLLDAANGKVRAVLGAEPYAEAEGAVCSADRRFLARQYGEGVVSVWDIAARSKLGAVKVPAPDESYAIALGPDAGQLAVWTGEHVRLYRRDAWSEPGRYLPPESARPAEDVNVGLRRFPKSDWSTEQPISFSPDGRYLAMQGQRKTTGWLPKLEIVLVKLKGSQVTRLPVVGDFAFSPDSTRLAIGGLGSSFQIWDVRAGTPVQYPQP